MFMWSWKVCKWSGQTLGRNQPTKHSDRVSMGDARKDSRPQVSRAVCAPVPRNCQFLCRTVSTASVGMPTALLVRRIRANVHRLGRSALETMLEVDWNVTEDYLPEIRYNGSPSCVGTVNVAACSSGGILVEFNDGASHDNVKCSRQTTSRWCFVACISGSQWFTCVASEPECNGKTS